MLDKLERLDLPKAMAQAVADTDDDIAALQRGQMFKGVRSDDSIMPNYAPISVTQYGKPPGPIKLFDTGAFYAGIKVDVRQDIFIIDSSDPKSTMLKRRYGGNIFGLGTAATQAYLLTLEPVFIQTVKNDLL